LDLLHSAGISQVGISVGVHRELVIAAVEARYRAPEGLSVQILTEDVPLGTGGALRQHADFFDGSPVLVVTGDQLTGTSIRDFIGAYENHPSKIAIATTTRRANAWTGDTIEDDGAGVDRYRYEPKSEVDLAVTCSTGNWIVSAEYARELPEGNVNLSRDVLPGTSVEPNGLTLFDSGTVPILDFGTAQRLFEHNLGLAAGTYPSISDLLSQTWSEPDEAWRAKGPMCIAAGVDLSTADLYGPLVVGSRCDVGADCVLSESVLFPGAVVPSRSIVMRSLVCNFDEYRKWLIADGGLKDTVAMRRS